MLAYSDFVLLSCEQQGVFANALLTSMLKILSYPIINHAISK